MNNKNCLPVVAFGLFAVLLNTSSCNAQNSNNKTKENNYTLNSGNNSEEKKPNSVSSGEDLQLNPTTPDIKGIYVASQWNKAIEEHVLKSPSVDGVFVRLYWDQYEPQNGKFDWSFLDGELKRIVDAGKKISIGVVAGNYSPSWVYSEGAPKLSFHEFRKQGKGKAFSADIPLPWHEKYLQAWTGFIKGLADYLKSKPDIYKNITCVKMSGINISTIELRLPSQKNVNNERGESTDAPAIWRQAGYKPGLVRNAWKQIVDSYNENFSDKYLSMAIIPKFGFPMIDESGNEMNENSDYDFSRDLIEDTHTVLKDRLIVQWNAIGPKGNVPKMMSWASQKGIKIGYQLEDNSFGHPDCLEQNTPCDQEMLKSVLDNAMSNNAAFVEIFIKDVNAFPQALAYGHQKLNK